jgi:hypothetical protein
MDGQLTLAASAVSCRMGHVQSGHFSISRCGNGVFEPFVVMSLLDPEMSYCVAAGIDGVQPRCLLVWFAALLPLMGLIWSIIDLELVAKPNSRRGNF